MSGRGRVLEKSNIPSTHSILITMPKIPDLKWRVRVAKEEDIPTILDLCYQLSVYEKIEFKGTEEFYKKYGFSGDKIFDCLLAENTGEVGPPFLGIII